MEKARKIIDIVLKSVAKLNDEEIESILNKEGKLVYVKNEQKIAKNDNINNFVFDLCKDVEKAKSRELARDILNKSNVKKDTLIGVAKHFEVSILKSYTKAKIVEAIVEEVVGRRLDSEAIDGVDIR